MVSLQAIADKSLPFLHRFAEASPHLLSRQAGMPRTRAWDSTLALLLNPYGFISEQCRRLETDVFQTRLLLQKTICMRGREAAECFYNEQYFQRRGAAPGRLQKTLFGKGGVQGLDGEAHQHRKQLFLSLVSPEQVERLAQMSTADWQDRARRWEREERVELYAEARENLTRAVCAWTGVPLEEKELRLRMQELTALFEHAAAIGPRHWWSRLARQRAERWAAGLVRAVRQGRLTPSAGSALQVIATYTELDGRLLPPRIAAVELLNILRPTVAVAVFITLAALALHHYPRCRDKLRTDDGSYAVAFAQEVRRFYPFFPAAAARVRQNFEWQGLLFPKGVRALLDLHGTNHDERLWDAPEEFRPERFLEEKPSPFAFIPQGGGDPAQHHRCPGEGIAVALMQAAIRFLNKDIAYEVPEQDLTLGDSRLPALPRSRMVIAQVRPRARLH